MAAVLTQNSNVSCGHGGSVVATGTPKLTINGSPVLLRTGIAGRAVSVCTTPPASDAGGPTAKACLTVTAVDSGEASKLTVGGSGVMLATLTGKTDGMVAKTTPQLLLSATAGQTKLVAS